MHEGQLGTDMAWRGEMQVFALATPFPSAFMWKISFAAWMGYFASVSV